jgi:hypothetical protein
MPAKRCAVAPLLVFTLLAGCGAIQPAPSEPLAPPAPPSRSEADADRKLAWVTIERAKAGTVYAASEQVCYTKFLVNRCLDRARELRRERLATLRAIEVEAEHFKRKAAVEQRDREIAEAEKKFEADNEARMAAEARPPHVPPPEPAPKTGAPVAKREAEHAAKEKQRAANQQAGAAKRAANVEAYEKRKRDAENRQREVEEKKKAKAREAEGK